MAEPNNQFISISFAHVMAESLTPNNGDDVAIAATHQTITAVPTNKRKSNDDNNSLNPLLDGGPSNKRRKKNKKKKGGKQHTQHNSKKKNKQQHKKKQQNWIESCSDSIDRVPTNCAAPLTCVITRVEIEEEPLLPKGSNSSIDDKDKDVSAKDRTDESGPSGDKISADSKTAANETSTGTDDHSNIARPSQTFTSQYVKERAPWMIPSTIRENDEDKRLFIPVKRDASAKGPTKWVQRRKKTGNKQKQQTSTFCHLPNGDNGDGILNPYPTSAVPDKFWAQRKRLFSLYDEGIQIGCAEDPEMWYSVTPEAIANHVAERMVEMMRRVENPSDPASRPKQEVVVLDLFCGCGGNSIAFARLNNVEKESPRVKVIAVDNNLSRLKMAASNAAIYKINREDIVFIHADAVEVLNHYSNGSRISRNKDSESRNYESFAGFDFGGLDLLPHKKLDGVFLSPPWGGMSYTDQGKDGFDPVTSITVESRLSSSANQKGGDEAATSTIKTNGGELLSLASKALSFNQAFGVVVYFLPRNADGIALGGCAVASGIGGCFEFEQNVVNGKVKTTTAYFQSGLEV